MAKKNVFVNCDNDNGKNYKHMLQEWGETLLKTLSCSVKLFVLLISGAAVVAGPGDTQGLTGNTGSPPPQVSCHSMLDSVIAEMKERGNNPKVRAYSTLLVGESAYAEGAMITNVGGFISVGGDAAPSGAGISGNGNLGALPKNAVHRLSFEIVKGTSGKVKLKWSFRGKNYQGDVNSCTSRYWTATANSAIASSAIAIKLGAVQAIQAIPR